MHSVPSNDRSFDLNSPDSRDAYKSGLGSRVILAVVAVFFFTLTLYAAAGLSNALSNGKNPGAYLFATVLIAFFTMLAASGAAKSLGKCATRLTLTEDSIQVHFPSRRTPVKVRWVDPSFRVVLRDFRGHPSPMSTRVQVESIGRAPFWLQIPTSPLTPPAFDALLSVARAKGLMIDQRKGSTKFALYPNTVTILHWA